MDPQVSTESDHYRDTNVLEVDLETGFMLIWFTDKPEQQPELHPKMRLLTYSREEFENERVTPQGRFVKLFETQMLEEAIRCSLMLLEPQTPPI